MGNRFDNLKRKAYDVTTRTMGYKATWQLSPGNSFTGEIHFKSPDIERSMGGENLYLSINPMAEFRKPFFPGLIEAVQSGNKSTILAVDNKGSYYVDMAEYNSDGDSVLLQLIPVQ